jgi:hypothetical protein
LRDLVSDLKKVLATIFTVVETDIEALAVVTV